MTDQPVLLSFSLTFRLNSKEEISLAEKKVHDEIIRLELDKGKRNKKEDHIDIRLSGNSTVTEEALKTDRSSSNSSSDPKTRTPNGSALPEWLKHGTNGQHALSSHYTTSTSASCLSTDHPEHCSMTSRRSRVCVSSPSGTNLMLQDVEKLLMVKCRVYLAGSKPNTPLTQRLVFEIGNSKTIEEVLKCALHHKQLKLADGFYKCRVFKTDNDYKQPEEIHADESRDACISDMYRDVKGNRSNRMIIDLTRSAVGGAPEKGSNPWCVFVRTYRDRSA